MSTSLRSLLKTLLKTSIYSANIAGSRSFPIIKFLHYTTLIITYWQIPLDEWLVVSALLYQVYCFFDRVVTSKRTPLLALLYFYRATPAPLPTFHSLDICSFCNGLIINWLHTIILGQIMYVQVNC